MFLALVTVSCTQKVKDDTNNSEMTEGNSTMNTKDEPMMQNESTTTTESTSKKMMAEKMYACPMHPEVQGKLNEKCPKCGMKLSEPVAENTVE